MKSAFYATGAILGTLFFIFISIVGWKASVGLFDAFARGQSDMSYYFVPGAKKFKMAHLYGLFLWGVIIFGILIINFGPGGRPDGDPERAGVHVDVRDGRLLPRRWRW